MTIKRRTDAEWMRERVRRPAYGEWRTLVEDCGGTMKFDRSTKDWVIGFGGRSKKIPTQGHHYRELDLCYGISPERSADPDDWDHYHGPFFEGCATGKLQEWFPRVAKDLLLFK